MLTLPFSVLPGSSQLFCDYSALKDDALHYFFGSFADRNAYEVQLDILSRRRYAREKLCNVLDKQNAVYFAGKQTFENIQRLGSSQTFCVFTGQQVGLFTGPLYTLYKALTTVHLAQWLKDEFPAYDFVPVFWLETEDHDLDEANHTGFIDKQNDFFIGRYGEEENPENRNLFPVGGLTFDARIEETILAVASRLQPSEYTESVLALLRSCYREGNTFAKAFAQMFFKMFPSTGIVFVDPSDPELKQIAAPVFLQELETFPTTGEEIIKRSAELEERYHAQVKPRAINLFYLHKGARHAIEPSDYGFFLRGSRQRFTKDELLEIANTTPENFSPNVLLRPIVQDFIFPTVAYVSGPAETAYFAQLQPVYDHFQIPMPIIFPRASLTIVEKKIQKLFNKFSLQLETVFDSPQEIFSGIFHDQESESFLQDFDVLRNEISSRVERLSALAAAANDNLVNPAKATAQNIMQLLSTFGEKLKQSEMEKHGIILRQLEKMQVYLSPEGKPQERQVNIITYLNRYGMDILKLIDEACLPFPSEHRLLMM
jgi:bacillithiol synthase